MRITLLTLSFLLAVAPLPAQEEQPLPSPGQERARKHKGFWWAGALREDAPGRTRRISVPRRVPFRESLLFLGPPVAQAVLFA